MSIHDTDFYVGYYNTIEGAYVAKVYGLNKRLLEILAEITNTKLVFVLKQTYNLASANNTELLVERFSRIFEKFCLHTKELIKSSNIYNIETSPQALEQLRTIYELLYQEATQIEELLGVPTKRIMNKKLLSIIDEVSYDLYIIFVGVEPPCKSGIAGLYELTDGENPPEKQDIRAQTTNICIIEPIWNYSANIQAFIL